MAASTALTAAGDTRDWRFMTRETVDFDTPASLDTAIIDMDLLIFVAKWEIGHYLT